jgi:rod shape-determining protein MreD
MAGFGSLGERQDILLPVRARTIVASLVAALVLDFLPWWDVRLAPQFAAVVLVFWCVRQPLLVGLGTGWVLGLIADAGNGVLLGEHALAYSLLAFLAVTLARRILWFGLGGQALHVVVLLLAAQGTTVLVRIVAGAEFPGWQILVGPLVGAALWPPLSWLLLLPQRRPLKPEEPA